MLNIISNHSLPMLYIPVIVSIIPKPSLWFLLLIENDAKELGGLNNGSGNRISHWKIGQPWSQIGHPIASDIEEQVQKEIENMNKEDNQ